MIVMIYVEQKNITRRWETCPLDIKPARWRTMYASMNSLGEIAITKLTHDALGAPEAYLLLYDRDRETIGLRPTHLGEKNGYPATERGRHGGRVIRGYRLIREFGITVFETVRFRRCLMDRTGVLILDLRDTCPATRKKKQLKY
jgi:hypothetical protein